MNQTSTLTLAEALDLEAERHVSTGQLIDELIADQIARLARLARALDCETPHQLKAAIRSRSLQSSAN